MTRCATACWLLPISLTATSAWGQGQVTFADLDGHAVEADVVREQVVRRRDSRFHTENTVRWKLVIGGNAIVSTVSQTSLTPRGKQVGPPIGNSYVLGTPPDVRAQGSGTGLWEFNDGTLMFMRTYQQGAYRISFAFARGPSGLTCTVADVLGREGAGGDIVMQSLIDDSIVTILSSKLVTTSCRVMKADEKQQ